MDRRFTALRIVGTVFKVLAWVWLVLGLLAAVASLVAGFFLGSQLDAVSFDVGGPLASGERPFDITDYEATAAQVTTMTQELTTLVASLNQLLASPNVQDGLPLAVDSAQDRSEEFVRYLVLLGIVLIFSSITGTVAALLGYRYLAARLEARLDKRRHA